MSDVDPLIKREIEGISLGVLENRDLPAMVLQRVRRRRMKRILFIVAGISIFGIASFGIYSAVKGNGSGQISPTGLSDSASPDNLGIHPAFSGLISKYPITWEQDVGDTGAISKAGGLGDTLGGLTARGLKVTWERCSGGWCPTTLALAVENDTQDIVSVKPSLMVYIDHAPAVSTTRPSTIMPKSAAVLVFTFPEFKDTFPTSPGATWQWNWFLTSLN